MKDDIPTNGESKSILLFGAVFTLIALLGIFVDIVVGITNGGNFLKLPQTAVERFDELHSNGFLGLYNLDLLSIIIQILLIPIMTHRGYCMRPQARHYLHKVVREVLQYSWVFSYPR